jgi:hypothetical protein
MGLLDNFLKDYDKDHYKRHPKAKKVIIAFYIIGGIVLILVTIRAIRQLIL